jgi:hypothetical protein
MPALQKKSYSRFIIPVEKTDFMSIDYYRGIMFVCNGFKIYRINPTTNKVMGVTDLDVTNPVIDIDIENQNNFLAICLDEKKVKRIDAYTGKVVLEIIIDRFISGAIVPFKLHSTMTKAPDGIYFIDGYFNSILKTNRVIKYDPVSRTSSVVNEISAANYNDLEFDDIGLLRLTDVKGVIERYNIITSSPNYGKQIDEIPVGDPFLLNEDIINPIVDVLTPGYLAPPDITYFLEQPFAALTLEPNWQFKTCANPSEWQIALNPCIPQVEQNINFIKTSGIIPSTLDLVDQVIVDTDTLVVTLKASLNYSNVALRVTNDQGAVKGNITNISNIYTFTLKNLSGHTSQASTSFELNSRYHLEVSVILDTDIIAQTHHSFNLDFAAESLPKTFNTPYDFEPPQLIFKDVDDKTVKLIFNENIENVNSTTFKILDQLGAQATGILVSNNNILTFVADSLISNEVYSVILEGITDLSGNIAPKQGFSFKYQNTPISYGFLPQAAPIDGSFEIILDAMEDKQDQSYEARQEMLFLNEEKEGLTRLTRNINTLIELNQERFNLLRDYDTTQFPYNYQLTHLDKAILEYSTIIGSSTLGQVSDRVTAINARVDSLFSFVTDLEEALRAAEFPNLSPKLFADQYEFNASEEYEVETAGQATFIFAQAFYHPTTGDLKVFVNDTPQLITIDYLETNSTSITFNAGLNIGDKVVFIFNPKWAPEKVVIPGNITLVIDPIINKAILPEVLNVATGVESPINLTLFKVFDALDREISLFDLDPFYFELENSNKVELRVNGGDYFLLGLADGEGELILHLANTTFKIPLHIETGITPSAFTPLSCVHSTPREDTLFQLVLEDLTVYYPEQTLTNHRVAPESHLVISGVDKTNHRNINPSEWALVFEGTLILPDAYEEGLILEYAQLNQDTEINISGFELVLTPILDKELSLVIVDKLDSDIEVTSENHLKLSPTAFDRDLVLENSLEFDPANPLANPLVLHQGSDLFGQSGSLQMQFICEDVPADDQENTLLLQGNTGGRHPTKITWDGDFCYVLYAGECAAELIDLKSIFRKVFISSSDPEIYGLGLHSTTIFAQARDIEGQEFALAQTRSKAISFVEAFSEYLVGKQPSITNVDTNKISISTTGSIFGPDTLSLDEGVIFNHNNESGITLSPGQSIMISFNTFKLLEGLTYLARTLSPIQQVIIETSNDGINFLESDLTVISKPYLDVYELNQFSVGVEQSKITTNVRFTALDTNTANIDIVLINLFYDKDRFQRSILPIQQVGAGSSKGLLVANQTANQQLDFVFSPDPLNFLNQTVAAPINPLVSTPLKTVLESSSLVVTGLPASGILPALFKEGSEFTAIAPISPITDIRGNSELIYRSGLMLPYRNLILNSDWHWGLLNWSVLNNPIIDFTSLLSTTLKNQISLTRTPEFQSRESGIVSKSISALPGTDYYVAFEGIDISGSGLGFIKLDYYDVKGDFISSSAPIFVKDTLDIVTIKKTSPDFTHTIKIIIGLQDRNPRTNPTTIDDIIKINWVCLSTDLTQEFLEYEDNLDVIKIMVES